MITAPDTKTLGVGLCCSVELSEPCQEHAAHVGLRRELSFLGDGAQSCSHQEKDPAVGGGSCHPDPLQTPSRLGSALSSLIPPEQLRLAPSILVAEG